VIEMSLPAKPRLPSVVQSDSIIQRVRIHSEFQIPAACDAFMIYKELKHTLQDSYSGSPWFCVEFRGLGTQQWILDARLNIGAKIIQRSFRRKFRAQILDSFKANMSHDQFCSFEKEFNKNRKALQIEEDAAPFTADKPHSWTRDGLPDIEDVAMSALLPAGPAAASIPAPGGAAQLTRALVLAGSASTAALLPAGSGPADGSSGQMEAEDRRMEAEAERDCVRNRIASYKDAMVCVGEVVQLVEVLYKFLQERAHSEKEGVAHDVAMSALHPDGPAPLTGVRRR
jgi:hypothetical protein